MRERRHDNMDRKLMDVPPSPDRQAAGNLDRQRPGWLRRALAGRRQPGVWTMCPDGTLQRMSTLLLKDAPKELDC